MVDRCQQAQLWRILRRQSVNGLHRNGRQAQALAQVHQFADDGVILRAVQFQTEERAFAIYTGQTGRVPVRGGEVTGTDVALDSAQSPAAQTDQPFAVPFQRLPAQGGYRLCWGLDH